jgi:hypothetical protein
VPLQLSNPPANAYQLLVQAIIRVSAAGGAASEIANVADPSRLSSVLPHKVYTLGASQIAQGRDLDRARLTGWRFLIQYGTKVLAAAELSCDPTGANVRFSSIDVGPFAKATRDVVMAAERLESVRRGSYELRVLRAPSVYAMAVWLKNLEQGEDIVLRIDPTAQAQTSGQAIGGDRWTQSSSQFVQSIRPAAKQSLSFDSRPKTEEGDDTRGSGAPKSRRNQ